MLETILLCAVGLTIIVMLGVSLHKALLFKGGDNPFHRICTKCGSHQVMYRSNIQGHEHATWWEEIYPLGNNEKCWCHWYADHKHS